MLSFFARNLLIPGDPNEIELTVPSGTWRLEKYAEYEKSKAAMDRGQCADTYCLENAIGPTPAARSAQAFEELTPILLGASYATGLAVTVLRSTMGSEMSIIHRREHWPRDRAIDMASPVINSPEEFRDLVERFIAAWPGAGMTEKARLLVHHWLDALACWSLEDLYLSATTLLQIIVATEANRQGRNRLYFYDGVEAAAGRMGIRVLPNDFKNMRDELIHDGQLIGHRFTGPDKLASAAVAADVLNWIDEYLHAALALGNVRKTRFTKADLANLNAYSIG
jgi:hypothetical protein